MSDWKNVLLMYDQMNRLKKIKPDLRVDKYYLVFVYNLLDMGRVTEAEAIFDEIDPMYFRGEADLDLDEAFAQGQKAVKLKNKLRDRLLMYDQKMEIEAKLREAQNQAELFIVITGFAKMAEKSNYISASSKLVNLKASISGKSYTLNLQEGLKITNH